MTAMTPLEHERACVAYEAWKNVVKAWPGDINDNRFDSLALAIRQWGERLAELRAVQDSQERLEALRYVKLLDV